MKYSIVYSSRTGNTELLARTIREVLPPDDCIYLGEPNTNGTKTELIFVGFWTERGSCDEHTAAFLQRLRGKRIFLFGTAGFGGSPDYFAQIIAKVKEYIDSSNSTVGAYMCQGKMPLAVRRRYEALLSENPKMQKMIDNFDQALSHPNTADLEQLKQLVRSIVGI